MIARNCDGVLQEPKLLSTEDKKLLADADALLAHCRTAMKTQQIHQALNAIWAVVADANRYFAAAAPWALKKTDPERMGTVLYVTAEVIRQVAILTLPAMPDAGAKLLDLLEVPEEQRTFAFLGANGRLGVGVKLRPPEPVFPRYVEPGTEKAG